MKRLAKENRKKGFIAIETILCAVLMLMIVLLSIGFFTTLYPRVALQLETRDLAQLAKIQGGLTEENVERFKEVLGDMGFVEDKVKVEAYTNPGNLNALNVTPLNEEGSSYIKRGSGEVIYIYITAPANTSIKAPLSYFGLQDKALKEYKIKESVMSERW